MNNRPLKIITFLSLILTVSLAVVSYSGTFVPTTYERDAPSMAAQGIGQDMVDLFLVVPLLLFSLFLVHRKNRVAYFIFAGTLFYIIYSFVIYSLGVHFNRLFLWYCLTLGLSLYAFLLTVIQLNQMEVESWFNPKLPVKIIGGYLIFVAVLFYLLWLKDVVPAILNNTIPQTVSDYNLLVNPVHVLDLSIVLPGFLITAILLIKKHRLGFVFAPIALVFILILTIALIGMVVMLRVKGISDETSVAGIFAFLAMISLIFLVLFFRNLRNIE